MSQHDTLTLAAKQVINHWQEFGPESGFDEIVYRLEKAVIASEPPEQFPPATPVSSDDLDAWVCSQCNGDGWHWTEQQVGERKTDTQEVRTHCDLCEGLGFLGPDAEKRRAALSATQPAQAAQGGSSFTEALAAWKAGAQIQYFVLSGYDSEWSDYTQAAAPSEQPKRLAWRIKPGSQPVKHPDDDGVFAYLDGKTVQSQPAPAAQGELEGWKLVPVEPTDRMVDAANKARLYREDGDLRVSSVLEARTYNSKQSWSAMLAASPTTPAQPAVAQGDPLRNVPDAMNTVIEALRSDPDYAWSWHCNVAMASFDEGMGHYEANQAAARFMHSLAGVDTTKHKGFPSEPDQQPAVAQGAGEAFPLFREAQAQQAGEVVTDSAGLSMLIAGALYDFAGYLTTHPDVIEVGATGLAGPMVDRLTDFAKRRNLSLGDAAVLSWQEALTTPPAPAQPEPVVPEGWKLVPVEPTQEMLASVSWPGCAKTDWHHMLAAAPTPPAQAKQEGEKA